MNCYFNIINFHTWQRVKEQGNDACDRSKRAYRSGASERSDRCKQSATERPNGPYKTRLSGVETNLSQISTITSILLTMQATCAFQANYTRYLNCFTVFMFFKFLLNYSIGYIYIHIRLNSFRFSLETRDRKKMGLIKLVLAMSNYLICIKLSVRCS